MLPIYTRYLAPEHYGTLELIEITDSQICCGSAGTYNLDQPEIAARLGKQKAECIIDSKPDVVASGNIGCIFQLNHCLGEANSDIRVRHTMQIMRDAYESCLMDGCS